VVVICGRTRYQLNHAGAPSSLPKYIPIIREVVVILQPYDIYGLHITAYKLNYLHWKLHLQIPTIKENTSIFLQIVTISVTQVVLFKHEWRKLGSIFKFENGFYNNIE